MSDFLTVKEAAQNTGKSSSSIRRIIYPILKDDNHPDRMHVRPTPDEARELRIRGENFPWRLSQELLDREVPEKPAHSPDKQHAGQGDEASLHEVVNLLREQLLLTQQQLQVKDQQIATFSEITKSLNERLREGNILIASLQRQLPLPADQGFAASASKATRPSNSAAKPAAKPQAKTPKPAVKKPEKRGFFARLFR